VLGRNYFWHIRFPLDLERMKKAAQFLSAHMIFPAFVLQELMLKDRVRTITDIAIKTCDDGLIEIKVESQGFLKIHGTKYNWHFSRVGRGKRKPDEMKVVIESRNRNIAGVTAPACGLFLKEVKY